jgi:hypothetical protein
VVEGRDKVLGFLFFVFCFIFNATATWSLSLLASGLRAVSTVSLSTEGLGGRGADSAVLHGSDTHDVRVNGAGNAVLHLVVELGHAGRVSWRRKV